MSDYLKNVQANATKLEIVVGIKPGNPDFLTVDLGSSGFTAGAVNTTLLNNPAVTGQFSTFNGGLSVLVNNTSFVFAPIFSANDKMFHDITITNGAASANAFDPNYGLQFGKTGKGGNYAQPGADSAGFFDNATFNFQPNIPTTPIPEPASVVLMVLGAFGLGVGAYRSRRKANKASAD
jgi:hypothetical protein